MKHYMIRTIFAVAVVVMATSCTDLDVDVKSKYTEYPTESEVALEAKMAMFIMLSVMLWATIITVIRHLLLMKLPV